MSVDFNYPQTIDPNTPAVAAEVQSNFDALLSWIKINYRQKDDTPLLTVMPTLPGEPINPQHAATKAYVDRAVPISTILEFAGTVLPTGFLWCDGSAYSETTEAALFAQIGTTYNTGGEPADSFRTPDKRGRVSVGFDAATAPFNVLGARGGQRDGELFGHAHTVPAHNHTATAANESAHTHADGTLTTNNIGGHGHNMGEGVRWDFRQAGSGLGPQHIVDPGPPANLFWAPSALTGPWATTGTGGGVHQHTVTGVTAAGLAHTHVLTVANKVAFLTDVIGAGTTLVDKNLQPFLVCNYIIRAR